MILSLADIETLLSEIKQDLKDVNELAEKNEKAYVRFKLGGDEYLDLAALGYTLHNLYGVMENLLYRIAKAFENNLNPSSWHKDLLNRMKLEVAGIRPAVLSSETFLLLDDLLGFRHVFRNQYNRGLDPDKVLLLEKKIDKTCSLFNSDIVEFTGYLNNLKKDLVK